MFIVGVSTVGLQQEGCWSE